MPTTPTRRAYSLPRILGLALVTVLATGAATAAEAMFSSGTDLQLAIPDNDTAGLSNTISVDLDETIVRLTVVVSLDHSFLGDLVWTLTGPDDTTITLADRPGTFLNPQFGDDSNLSAADGLAVSFTDLSALPAEGMGYACQGTDAIVGQDCPRVFAPNEELATFNLTSTLGDWTLNISDTAENDTGTLDGWILAFETEAATPIPLPGGFWLLSTALFTACSLRARDQRRG
jgi:subtilisin-like proprotein convertase family protein